MTATHGFTILRTRPLPELGAELTEMAHEKTGLHLIWLNRDDENKTFAIAFPTLPEDDTGVFHILEHAVLSGSDRYPVKEPFTEMMKGSLNTYLNAMTFADKTVYPISTRNDQDFLNLMRVYLDAVFHPLIYRRPEVFRQEGWHWELDGEGRPSYKGVVLNEMKGAFASADELSGMLLNRLLYPDTPYRFVSGGDPAHIPDLSRERFLETHRRVYAPGNAWVVLDGRVDLDTALRVLDEEYLRDLPRTAPCAPPEMQRPVTGACEAEYELPPEEDPETQHRLTEGFVIGRFSDRLRQNAAAILAAALCSTNQSPLCRVILDEDLAEEVSLGATEGLQPALVLEVKNFRMESLPRIEALIDGELRRLAREGLDHTQLEAILTNLEFRYRERDFGGYPAGLVFGQQVLDSWMFDGDPAANLEAGDLFSQLRAWIAQGRFERLLEELMLNNPHRARVLLHPSHTAGEARRAAEQERLRRETAAWTAQDRDQVARAQAELLAWQSAEDTPEALATVPQLTLRDIPPRPEQLTWTREERHGITVLRHPEETCGIGYVRLYFDAGSCRAEELSCLSYLCELVGECDTALHTSEELTGLMRLTCGQAGVHTRVMPVLGKAEPAVRLTASYSALSQNLERGLGLMLEQLLQVRFDEARAREVLRQTRQDTFEDMVMAGSGLGLDRLEAQFAPVGVARDATDGLGFYRWLRAREDDWDFDALREAMTGLLARLLTRRGLVLSLTGVTDAEADRLTAALAEALPDRPLPPIACLAPLGVRREGIVIPSDVGFAVAGGDWRAHGGRWGGVMQLTGKIVSLEYLWSVIRVQGGAYGAGLTARHAGLMAAYSYRDPGTAASLDAYRQAGAFLRAWAAGHSDLSAMIIGTVADHSPLYTPRSRSAAADGMALRGISNEDANRWWQELLSATPAQLAETADVLEATMDAPGLCLVGSQDQVAALDGLDEVIRV